MPPWILAAIPALVAAIAVARVLVKVVIPLWAAQLREADLRRLAKVLSGLAEVAVPLAKMTPGDIDDAAAALIADASKEVDALVKKYPVAAENMSKAIVVQRSKSLASMSGAPVGVR